MTTPADLSASVAERIYFVKTIRPHLSSERSRDDVVGIDQGQGTWRKYTRKTPKNSSECNRDLNTVA